MQQERNWIQEREESDQELFSQSKENKGQIQGVKDAFKTEGKAFLKTFSVICLKIRKRAIVDAMLGMSSYRMIEVGTGSR